MLILVVAILVFSSGEQRDTTLSRPAAESLSHERTGTTDRVPPDVSRIPVESGTESDQATANPDALVVRFTPSEIEPRRVVFHEGEDEIDALQVGPTSWQRRSTDPISPDAKLTVELGPATSVEVTEFRRQEVVVTLPRLGEMEARLEGGMSGEQWSCSVKPLENGQSPSRVDHRLVAEGATAIFVSRFETLDLETDQRARVLAFPGSTWSVRAVYRSYELEPSYAEVICPGSAVFVPASTFPTISITGLPEGSRVALYQATRGRGPVP